MKAGIPVEKRAIIHALKSGKLHVYHWPPNYGPYAHRDVCRWAGIDPATLPQTWPDHEPTVYPDIGLSYRAWRTLNRAGLPITKKAVIKALKSGRLSPTKGPSGYGPITHAEICRWAGVDMKSSSPASTRRISSG